MTTCTLRVDAHLWSDASHKVLLGKLRLRLPKGTKVIAKPDITGARNNCFVEVLADCDVGGVVVARKGDKGHMTAGKLDWDGPSSIPPPEVQNIALNGIGKLRNVAWAAEDQYEAEIKHFSTICGMINELIAMSAEEEVSVERWKTIAINLKTVEIAIGLTLLGLAIAASVVTLGAAVPVVIIALGVTASAAGVVGTGAKINMNKKLLANTVSKHALSGVTTSLSVGSKVKAVVDHTVRHGASSSGGGIGHIVPLAANAALTSVAAIGGGAVSVGTGLYGVHSLSKIDSSAVWSKVDFKAIGSDLTIALVHLREQRKCVPKIGLSSYDAGVSEVQMTLDSLLSHLKRPKR